MRTLVVQQRRKLYKAIQSKFVVHMAQVNCVMSLKMDFVLNKF